MTRIPPAEMTGPYAAIAKRMSRKMLGEVPESLGVGWHNRNVLNSVFGLGRKAQKWNECDADLKAFAHMAVARRNCQTQASSFEPSTTSEGKHHEDQRTARRQRRGPRGRGRGRRAPRPRGAGVSR